MNAIYYERRLRRLLAWSFWLSVSAATFASGSGLATLLQASAYPGWVHLFWKVGAVVAAVSAIIGPIYAPGKKIEQCTRQQRGYQAEYNSITRLIFFVKTTDQVTDEHRKMYVGILERHAQLEADDEVGQSRSALIKAQLLAEEELPEQHRWWPQQSGESVLDSMGTSDQARHG
jgi:hypothetical protein